MAASELRCDWTGRFEEDGVGVEARARSTGEGGSTVEVMVAVTGKAWPGKAVHLLGRLGALGLVEVRTATVNSMVVHLKAEPWNEGAAIGCWSEAVKAAKEVLA